jgi:hypothetical protein
VGVCADLFHRNMERDDLAEAIIDAGRWIARMHMTAGRRPYREVGQFGQVVGVVSPQPSTGARSTGGDIRNDKLQQLHLGHGHHVASLDVLIEPFTSRTYAVATLIFSSVACSYTTPWDAT